MRHEVVRTVEQWNTLRTEWNDLLLESRANTLFLTWQWLDTWMQLQDVLPQLIVVCVRDGQGHLRGVAPFYVAEYALLGALPYRVLRIIGDTDTGAEYQTWIATTGDEDKVFTAAVTGLLAVRSEWDLIWIPNMNAWSGLDSSLTGAMRAGGLSVNQRPNVFSAFSLPDDFDSYLKKMSANRRQQVRRMSRKILGEPNVQIKKVRSKEEVAPALEALFELHGKRWRAAGEEGVFVNKPKEKAFYERYVPLAFDNGWLGMYSLLDSGVPKAVQIGYVYDRTFLQLQEGFDPDYSSHVGNVLRAFVIEDCIGTGCRTYDFLGGSSEHKSRWLGEERLGADLLAARPGLKNMLIMSTGFWPTGAYLRPRATTVQ
jgi:CelD/BcsL family acetyltransferase involved in cellulose biosynthesis